ncbi:MAG TPA: hypothetical protein VF638_14285 [Sphingomonas sp.]|jgi:hypothetical protein
MYTDAQLRPSQAQALTAAGTTVSTNVIDLLSPSTNLGRGRPRKAYASVVTAMVGGTSVQAQFVQSANADLSSPDVLAVGLTTNTAQATVGRVLIDVVIPDNTKRYVGFQYVVTGTFTAGAVSAYVLADTPQQPYLTANTGF